MRKNLRCKYCVFFDWDIFLKKKCPALTSVFVRVMPQVSGFEKQWICFTEVKPCVKRKTLRITQVKWV